MDARRTARRWYWRSLLTLLAIGGAGLIGGCPTPAQLEGGDFDCSEFKGPCSRDSDCCGSLPCIDGVCL